MVSREVDAVGTIEGEVGPEGFVCIWGKAQESRAGSFVRCSGTGDSIKAGAGGIGLSAHVDEMIHCVDLELPFV